MLRYAHISYLLYCGTAHQISANAKTESLPRNEDGKKFHLNCLRYTIFFKLLRGSRHLHFQKQIHMTHIDCLLFEAVNCVHIPLRIYVGHLESKERLRIQPAQLFNFS